MLLLEKSEERLLIRIEKGFFGAVSRHPTLKHREKQAGSIKQERDGLRSQAEMMDTTVAVRSPRFAARLGEDAQTCRSAADLLVAAAAR